MEPSHTQSPPLEHLQQELGLSDEGINQLEAVLQRFVEDRVPAPPPLWTIKDVATRLNVSKRTVETIIDEGKITPTWVRGQRRFEPEVVEAYLRRNVDRPG